MDAVDTNVLLYVHDPRDPDKQTKATVLIRSLTDGALLWQVACEYLAASRKLASQGYGFPQAWQDVQDLRRIWPTLLPSWQVLERANKLMQGYMLSYWDAMIIAACLEGGVSTLYSEDFDAYANVDGLVLKNPFR